MARTPRFDHTDDLLDAPVAVTLDLHGRRADEVRHLVESFIATQARARPGQVVRIITGRGRNSRGAPVLGSAVRDLLKGLPSTLVREFDRGTDDGSYLVRLR